MGFKTNPLRNLVFVAGFLFPFLIPAQSGSDGLPWVQQYPGSVYKAGTQNWDIAQDGNGFMYFANNDGLLVLEGNKWTTLPLPNFTIMRSVAVAGKNRIWVGGQDETGYFERNSKGEWVYTSIVPLIPEEWKGFEDIWKIFPTPERVYFCSQKVIFVLEGQTIRSIAPVERFDHFFMPDSILYARDTRAGLLFLEGTALQPVSGGAIFTSNFSIRAILPHSTGTRLVVTAEQGLFKMEADGVFPWSTVADKFAEVYSALRLSDGNYAIGTTTEGVMILDPNGNLVARFDKQNGLQNNTVLSLFEDRQKNLWLGLDNGIDYIQRNSPFSLLDPALGIAGTGYAAVLYQGKIILGTNQGLFQKDNNTGRFQKIPGLGGQVWCLANLEKQLLVGHHNGLFEYRDGTFRKISPEAGVWKLIRLRQYPDYFLAGTYDGLSLYHYDADTQQWGFVKRLEGFDESARVFEEDHQGNIWVSHVYKGLYRVNLDMRKQLINGVDFFNSDDGLPGDLRINVGKIREEVVFATPRGLYGFDESSARFLPHDNFAQIVGRDSKVNRILEDDQKNIWFASEEAFGMIQPDEFGLKQAFDTYYFNHLKNKLVDKFEYVFTTGSNDTYIGARSGFIHYNGKNTTTASDAFKTYLTQVKHINAPDTLIYALVPDSATLAAQPLPEFLPAENSFSFSFTAPFYEEVNGMQYRYRLEGYEDRWSAWTEQTEKEYTNLPHGRYTFFAQAKNPYNQLSNAASWTFIISTPWYATQAFRIFLGILGLFFLVFLHAYYTRKMEKEKKQLKIKQAQKLEEKEAAFRQEVRKSEAEIIKLTNEKLEADIRHKSRELASATMHLMQKAEMMNKLREDLKKLQQNVIPENSRKIQQLVRNIEMDMQLDEEWEQFELHFDQVHENFLKKLREKYPSLTPKDQKLCAYLRMNLSTKEIAPLMKISIRGVEISRYRLRKKLDLDPDTNLIDFMIKL